MVAHLVRLKVTLLRNQMRASTGQLVGLLLSAAFGLLGLLALGAGLVYLRSLTPDEVGVWLTVVGSVVVAGWALAPLTSFGADETLDPQRFITFAIGRRDFMLGMLAASFVSVPAALTLLASAGTMVAWSHDLLVASVALVAGLLGAATCLVVTRAAATVLASVQSRRKGNEITTSVGLILIVVVSMAIALGLQGVVAVDGESLARVAPALGWSPLGWAWSVPWEVATGSSAAAAVKLLLATLFVAANLWLWGWTLDRNLVRRPAHDAATAGGSSSLDRLPGVTGAVAARCLRYWRRDPRYTTSIAMTLILPVLLGALVLLGVISVQTYSLVVGPVVASILGWSLHNDISYDGSPWWLHVATTVRGRAEWTGRAVGVLVWGLPLVLLAATLGPVLSGRSELVPAVVGLSVAFLGSGIGVSAVAAVLAPYWAPAAGESPTATPPGVGAQMVIGQVASGLAMTTVAGPTIIAFVFAWLGSSTAVWVALTLGLVNGVAAAAAGIVVGGDVQDRRAPELLATVAR